MLSRAPSGYPEKQALSHNITQVAVNFAEYSYAQMWWGPQKQPGSGEVAAPRKAVIWLHPYSYQNGYHADYAQGSTAMYLLREMPIPNPESCPRFWVHL